MLKKFTPAILSVALISYVVASVDMASVVKTLSNIDATGLVVILCLMVANIAVVSFRLVLLVRAMGVGVPFWDAVRANLSGLLSSFFLINIVGSIVGRFVVLRRHASAATVTATTTLERVLLILVGGALFIAGMAWTFGYHALLTVLTRFEIPHMIAAVGLAILLFFTFVRPRAELTMLRRVARASVMRITGELFFVTLLAQFLMLAAYVATARALGVALDLPSLFAVAAVIAFIASMPVTVNGWGLREFASIYAFSAVGVGQSTAAAIAVLVGLCSTVAVLLCAPILLTGRKPEPASDERDIKRRRSGMGTNGVMTASSARSLEFAFVLVAALVTTVLIFFQVHAQVGGNMISVNLADPFAVLGLLTLVLLIVMGWRPTIVVPRPCLWWFVGITVVIVAGFSIGALRIGVTQWALMNRLVGWSVILGYVVVSAAFVHLWGQHALRRLCEVMVVTAAAVVLFSLAFRETVAFLELPVQVPSFLEGFTANRNAFAFQLLIAASGALAYSKVMVRADRGWILSILLGIIFFGIWRTQSKTGVIVLAVLFLTVFMLHMAERRVMMRAALCAGALFMLFASLATAKACLVGNLCGGGVADFFLGGGDGGVASSGPNTTLTIQSMSPANIALHWLTVWRSWEMWLDHPIFGAGLGAFVNLHLGTGGEIVVIHSTPLWILAEMGLVGALTVLSLPVGFLYRHRYAITNSLPPHAVFLVASCLCFVVFGLPHDIFYQRIFWFALGGCMAAWVRLDRPLRTWRRIRQPAGNSTASAYSTLEQSPDTDSRPLDIHVVVNRLDIGGTERHLNLVLPRLDRRRFRITVQALHGGGALEAALQHAGIPLKSPNPSLPPWLQRLSASFSLLRRLLLDRPDVLHLFLPESYLIGGFAGLLTGQRNIVMSRRSLNNYHARYPILGRMERWLHRHVTVLVGNSRAVVAQLQEEAKGTGDVRLIYNGIQIVPEITGAARRQAREQFDVSSETVVFAVVANLIPYKGHADLLRGFADADRRLSVPWKLYCIGRDDGIGGALQALSEDLDIADHIVWEGEKADIRPYLALADVGILTSHEEGFSNSILEGMAASLPMIATDVGGNSEAIVHGRTGLLVPPRDPAAIGEAVVQLVDDADLRASMGREGRRRMEMTFSLERCVQQYQNLYMELVPAAPHASRHSSTDAARRPAET